MDWETALATIALFLVTLVIGFPMVDEWREWRIRCALVGIRRAAFPVVFHAAP